MSWVVFITHPDVVIDPTIPVPDWRLSPRGLDRMRLALRQPWVRELGSLWSSAERKALDAAAILAGSTGLAVQVRPDLGENDRSATGYLTRDAFEAAADAFFAQPHDSVRGWERAIDAQRRIVTAVSEILATKGAADRGTAIVAHGAVGALLLCHLQRWPITRAADQPAGQGGHFFRFDAGTLALVHGWQKIEE